MGVLHRIIGGGSLAVSEVNFTSQTLITVNHNLGKKVIVTVIDSSGDYMTTGVDIDYVSGDTFTVSADIPISGTILYF